MRSIGQLIADVIDDVFLVRKVEFVRDPLKGMISTEPVSGTTPPDTYTSNQSKEQSMDGDIELNDDRPTLRVVHRLWNDGDGITGQVAHRLGDQIKANPGKYLDAMVEDGILAKLTTNHNSDPLYMIAGPPHEHGPFVVTNVRQTDPDQVRVVTKCEGCTDYFTSYVFVPGMTWPPT